MNFKHCLDPAQPSCAAFCAHRVIVFAVSRFFFPTVQTQSIQCLRFCWNLFVSSLIKSKSSTRVIFRLTQMTQSRRLGCKTVQKECLSQKLLHGCISTINCFPLDLVQLYTLSIPSFGWVKIPQQRCRPAEELSHCWFSSAWLAK